MDTIVALSEEVRHRSVFEIRYRNGYEYWDRFGRITNEILRLSNSWELKNVDAQATHIVDRERNLVFSFGPTKIDLAQTQSAEVAELVGVEEFAGIADELSNIVVSIVNPSGSERLGYRVWRIYGTESKEDAEVRVKRLQCLVFPEELGSVAEASCTVVLERPDHMLRAVVVSCEQSLTIPRHVLETAKTRPERMHGHQKKARIDKYRALKAIKTYPPHGVLLDTDAYLEDPPQLSDLPINDFILNAENDVTSLRESLLTARKE